MPKESHKTGRQKKTAFVSVPMSEAQKEAVLKAARKLGLDVAGFSRMQILKGTDYDPDSEEE